MFARHPVRLRPGLGLAVAASSGHQKHKALGRHPARPRATLPRRVRRVRKKAKPWPASAR